MPYSFIFDLNRCTGCQACRLACTIENELEPDRSFRKIDTFNRHGYPMVPLFHLSLACNHCAEAPCMEQCPAGAYSRDEKTGAVLLDRERCIGCKYCSWVCPYDAPRFNEVTGVMEKCTLCNEHVEEGRKPACAALCPTGALEFDFLNDGELLHDVEGFPETGIKPAIKIVPLRGERQVPECTSPSPAKPIDAFQDTPHSGLSLKQEWPLVAFTLIAALMVAATAASVNTVIRVEPFVLPGSALIGLILASLHLGRKPRAWLSMVNVNRSWLSREVVLFTLFSGVSTLYLYLFPESTSGGWLAVILGFITLFTIDRVYKATMDRKRGNLHSADLVLTGVFLAGILLSSSLLTLLAGSVKLGLYLHRKSLRLKAGQTLRPLASGIRIIAGFLVPLMLWPETFTNVHLYMMISATAGELIDRSEFYMDLETKTPCRQITIDLKKRIEADSRGEGHTREEEGRRAVT